MDGMDWTRKISIAIEDQPERFSFHEGDRIRLIGYDRHEMELRIVDLPEVDDATGVVTLRVSSSGSPDAACPSILAVHPDMKLRCQATGEGHSDHHWASLKLAEYPSGRFTATRLEWTSPKPS